VKGLVWAVSALLVAAIGTCASADAKVDPRVAVLHVSIFNDSVSLEGSDSTQTVSLAGDVLVEYVVLVTVKVVLSGSTDLGWSVSVMPPEMSFSASTAQYFNATVTVPGGTYNRSAVLTVRGNATIPPGVQEDTASDTAVVIVLGNGGGSGQPPTGHGKPGRTGVDIPSLPLILGAATAAAAIASAILLWHRGAGLLRRTVRGRKGTARRRPAGKPPRDG
jgi:hypothetical protein